MTMFFDGQLIAHVHVNWLAPVKVRRTLLGGSRRMIVFDDLEASEKIKVYDRGISVNPEPGKRVPDARRLPRRRHVGAAARHHRGAAHRSHGTSSTASSSSKTPRTDGHAGLRVVRLLEAATRIDGAAGALVLGRRINARPCQVREDVAGRSSTSALFALAAAFRFLALKNGFVNDHFVYISGGRQMLFGEWPTRDWIDPGLPLMFGASALAQAVFGSTLFAEAVLVSIAFGLAAAFTAAAVRQLTGSMALAILAALFEIAVFPRTYSYPKIVAYAFEFWLYGRYLARPDRGRLFAMAAGVAVAFMFRHDHGLFLGVGAVLTILLARESAAWKTSARDAAMFTAIVAVLLLPYLVYVQAYGGLWVYFRTGVEFSQREALRQWHVWPRVFGDERPLESALVYMLYLLPLIAIGIVLARGTRARLARTSPRGLRRLRWSRSSSTSASSVTRSTRGSRMRSCRPWYSARGCYRARSARRVGANSPCRWRWRSHSSWARRW